MLLQNLAALVVTWAPECYLEYSICALAADGRCMWAADGKPRRRPSGGKESLGRERRRKIEEHPQERKKEQFMPGERESERARERHRRGHPWM